MEGLTRSGRAPSPVGPEFATATLDRRRFLILAGGAAAYALLRPPLAWARHLDAAAVPLQPWRLPEALPAAPLEAARALIGAAVLAPSYLNSQPWRFEVDGGEIRLLLDPARTLPVSDPDQRLARLSLGAALENLLVAARAWGQQPAVRYLPWGAAAKPGGAQVVASVGWQPAERPRDRLLFESLADRRTNPRHYDGRAVTMPNRALLLAQATDDVHVHWLEDRDDLQALADLVHDAVLARMDDARGESERLAWVRFGGGEEERRGDGVTPEHLGLAGPARWFAGRVLPPGSRFHGWGEESFAKNLRDAVRSAGAAVLFATPRAAAGGGGDAAPVLAGQAYERFAILATSLGIAQQPLSAPIESERHRALLARRFGAANEEPMLLVRVGHADPPDPTPRRAVALVSTYRTS